MTPANSMNVKRFSGRTSREAMQKVRQAFGDNAVVLSTQPSAGGVEVLAMAPESVAALERFRATPAEPRFEPVAERAEPAPPKAAKASPLAALRHALQSRAAPAAESPPDQVHDDVRTLSMSTLSFQDYVRERMLKKREAELRAKATEASLPDAMEQRLAAREQSLQAPGAGLGLADLLSQPAATQAPLLTQVVEAPPALAERRAPRKNLRLAEPMMDDEPAAHAPAAVAPQPRASRSAAPVADEPVRAGRVAQATQAAQEQGDMMRELRAMKGMIEERFGAMAFMERLQMSPKRAQLTGRLIECGFSPALIRKLVESMGDDVGDEIAWAGGVLQRNLMTGEAEPALEDQGGVYALVGSTGVGKTTSTAKLAAAFAARHGASNLGLITLDAYRLGAHEQLRAYGRILGVPVHTAHDRVALEDLLDLLSSKKMVLIDTAGLAQRDTRTRELLEMLSHPAVQRLLVVNAAAQGETTEDVLVAYKASSAKGVVLSKLDEAVKLGPALDAVIRHRLKVVAVANGQRVPEDWHRLTAQALMHRALRCGGAQAWRMDASEINLMFAAQPRQAGSPRRSSRTTAAVRSA
ncbi:MAG: flagellar biosynthesis protein FlhF [Burkholderiales bacterium]